MNYSLMHFLEYLLFSNAHFTVECELCVYGQEKGEIEMITQFSFGHN
jgi:hypothetical protein